MMVTLFIGVKNMDILRLGILISINQGHLFTSIVSAELIVSSPDEITRELLEREATLLDSVVRETECEAVTEREDTYEVIIDNPRIRRKYAIGKIN